MTDWEGPRRARVEEFDEAMRFTDRVFRPGQRGRRIVAGQYPHVYREEPTYARRLLLLRDRGELVGCVGVHPMTLCLGEARVSAGGIGIVGTHPERRGEGIMTTLLHDALRRMIGAGHCLSVLGGDRLRYGRFGWECGGVRNTFELTSRTLGAASPAERRQRLQRFPRTPDDALCRRILRLGAARAYRVARRLGDIRPLMGRNGRETWICEAGRRFAYVVVSGPERRPRPYAVVDEFGGDDELVLAMLRRLLARTEGGRLIAITGPNPDQIELLTPVCPAWNRCHDGMINILHLPRLVEQLRPELRRRAAEQGVHGRFRLRVAGDVDPQDCDLTLGRPGARSHRVTLDRRAFVRLFFGSLPLSEAFGAHAGLTPTACRLLAAILPLPLHMPALDHI